MSLPAFHIPPDRISGDTAVMTGDELRHARLTLRLGPGDAVRLLDGEGGVYEARFREVGKTEAELEIETRTAEPAASFELVIAMGIVQGERFDWAIQKGTELGASAFIPLVTERAEYRPGGQWSRLDRLRRVAVAACKQCMRAWFPAVRQPVVLEELETGGFDLTVAFWEDRSVPALGTALDLSLAPRSCLMVVGPVGGLTPAEAQTLAQKGAVLAGMGPRILRTETAVTAGAALLQYLYGDMGSAVIDRRSGRDEPGKR